MMLVTMSFTSLMGMAKPMPSMEASEEEALADTMPTAWPYRSNKGPPELPELMAVSVWSIFIMVPSLMVMVRSLAETSPPVRVKVSSPRGLPMA